MENLDHVETVVIKIGTSSILDENGELDSTVLTHLADDVAELWRSGKRIAIVTSGAVGLGRKVDGEDERTSAGRGMGMLLRHYSTAFEGFGLDVAQLLISSEQLSNMVDMKRVADRIRDWWKTDTVPILNENDPIAFSEVTRGDNDSLAATVARHLNVDSLVFMSIDKESGVGRGGRGSKAAAISEVELLGMHALVVDGKARHVIKDLFGGGSVLTQALRDSARIKNVGRNKISV